MRAKALLRTLLTLTASALVLPLVVVASRERALALRSDADAWFSRDGGFVIVRLVPKPRGGFRPRVKLLDAATGWQRLHVAPVSFHDEELRSRKFSGAVSRGHHEVVGGRWLVVANAIDGKKDVEGPICLIDIETGETTSTLDTVSFSGWLLNPVKPQALGYIDGYRAEALDVTTRQRLWSLKHQDDGESNRWYPTFCEFSRDGTVLTTAWRDDWRVSEKDALRSWNTRDWHELPAIRVRLEPDDPVVQAAGGRLTAWETGSADDPNQGVVTLRTPDAIRHFDTGTRFHQRGSELFLSPGGSHLGILDRWVAPGSGAGPVHQIRIIDTDDGREIRRLTNVFVGRPTFADDRTLCVELPIGAGVLARIDVVSGRVTRRIETRDLYWRSGEHGWRPWAFGGVLLLWAAAWLGTQWRRGRRTYAAAVLTLPAYVGSRWVVDMAHRRLTTDVSLVPEEWWWMLGVGVLVGVSVSLWRQRRDLDRLMVLTVVLLTVAAETLYDLHVGGHPLFADLLLEFGLPAEDPVTLWRG